jgi:hypothetical protein
MTAFFDIIAPLPESAITWAGIAAAVSRLKPQIVEAAARDGVSVEGHYFTGGWRATEPFIRGVAWGPDVARA